MSGPAPQPLRSFAERLASFVGFAAVAGMGLGSCDPTLRPPAPPRVETFTVVAEDRGESALVQRVERWMTVSRGPVRPPTIDLGMAAYPHDAKGDGKVYTWQPRQLGGDDFKLVYFLSEQEQRRIRESYEAFADWTGFTDLGAGKYRWNIPPGCARDMGCTFGVLAQDSRDALSPLVQLFRDRAKRAHLSRREAASLVLSFVQQIPYERPDDQPFEILPPASVVAEGRGDCDSKALLAHLLLREMRIDNVMLSSKEHHHAMLGVAVPTSGKKIRHQGKAYAFTELTVASSPIGHVNAHLLEPNDWRVVPTRWPSAPPLGAETYEGGRP